jgi:carbon-monoxide dehydrogenase large subunit
MSILGNRVLRKEDPRFLRGEGHLRREHRPGGTRSPSPSCVRSSRTPASSIDTSAALELPGVQVFTGADIDIPPMAPPPIPLIEARMARPILATDVVRFVGDIVAAVVSEDRAAGVDAAELVMVEYDPLPAAVTMGEALKGDVLLFPEVESNISTRLGVPEFDETLFEGCEVVVSDTLVSPRMAGCPLEPRSAAAEVGPDGRTTAWISTQVPHADHMGLHLQLGLEPSELRLVAPDVGGGFGVKCEFSRRCSSSGWLASWAGRCWTETRSESMIGLPHGRAQRHELTLGGTRDGKILAYRMNIFQDAGSYPQIGSFLPMLTGLLASGVYASRASRRRAHRSSPTRRR